MRINPSKEWYTKPTFLKNDENGYLINPDINDIYWFHGMVGKPTVDYIYDLKDSGTLYLSSSYETAQSFATRSFTQGSNPEFFESKPNVEPIIYEVLVKLPSSKIFDIRKAVFDESYRKMAIQMLSRNPASIFSYRHFQSVYESLELLQFRNYDHYFNENERSKLLLKEYGFLGWLETESYMENVSKEEPLTLALLQEETEDLVFVWDELVITL